MSFFKIKNLSPALDGLYVEGIEHDGHGFYLTVTRIINRNAIVGDRNVAFPVALQTVNGDECGLIIDGEYLERVEDIENREYSHTNPWGKCVFDGRYISGALEIAYARFEKAVQVSVIENQSKTSRGTTTTMSKTIFTDYYYEAGGIMSIEKVFDMVKTTIEKHLSEGGDVDDLVFSLKSLKEKY